MTAGYAVRPSARQNIHSPAQVAADSSATVDYVYPGQVAVGTGSGMLVTILGSCVAVCLHDAELGLGGMNHYLLPTRGTEAEKPGRYGPSAIEGLLEAMLARGASRTRLVAHVVGGASVLAAYQDAEHLGLRNATLAQEMLAALRLPIAGLDVGGTRGRRLQFAPHDGQVSVNLIGA